MPEEYKTIMHRWFDEVWNQQRTDTIDELMTDETIHHGLAKPDGEAISRLDDFKNFHRAFINAFPDLHVEVEDVMTDGNKLAVRCSVTGTHTGDGLGFAPTNQRVEFTGGGMCIFEDGKFTEVWNEFDFMKMHTQMGTVKLDLQ